MQNRTTVRYEYKEYRKLPVISPERIHLSKGVQEAYKRGGGVYIRGGLYEPEQKKRIETSNSSADPNTFCIYWFVTKLQSVIINRIQRGRGGGGGLISRGLIIACMFYRQIYALYEPPTPSGEDPQRERIRNGSTPISISQWMNGNCRPRAGNLQVLAKTRNLKVPQNYKGGNLEVLLTARKFTAAFKDARTWRHCERGKSPLVTT